MPAPGQRLVIPGIVRFAVRGLIAGRQWVNIYDVDISEGRPAANSSMDKCAEVLMDQYATNIAPLCVAQWSIVDCRWVDLNSANGVTGIKTDTAANNFPKAGAIATDGLPANVAVLGVKAAVSGRGQRSGRCYFAGLPEASTTGNTIPAGTLTGWTTALNAIRNGINNANPPNSTVFSVAGEDKAFVVHKSAVTAYTPSSTVATMRRRLRG